MRFFFQESQPTESTPEGYTPLSEIKTQVMSKRETPEEAGRLMMGYINSLPKAKLLNRPMDPKDK